MQWSQLGWVAVGGAAGACCRFLLSSWINQRLSSDFPWGTFAANMLGSILFGVLFVLVFSLTALREPLRLTLLVGFLGAFTTFSTFAFETVRLAQEGQWWLVAVNIIGSNLACLLGLWIAMSLTRSMI